MSNYTPFKEAIDDSMYFVNLKKGLNEESQDEENQKTCRMGRREIENVK